MVVSERELKLRKTRDKGQDGALIQGADIALQSIPEEKSASNTAALTYSNLENVSKSSLERIHISQLPKEIPNFKTPGVTKDTLITEWLIQWIEQSLEAGTLTENHLLPKKEDIAKYLNVSVGTVQNAIRIVEDEGHVESKQRIGTLIRKADQDNHRMRKQTSKRDQAVIAVQKFILDNHFQVGDSLPSARDIANRIGSAPNTTRLALEFLTNQDILLSRGTRGNKANWELKRTPDQMEESGICVIESETLIDQLERDLKMMISEQFEINRKLPSHLEMADMFKVSIKTVHDAMKRLADQGIIRSKRGRYGTYVVRKPDTNFFTPSVGNDIFLNVEDASFYNYEKVECHLKNLIRNNYKVGDKLPAMSQLSEQLDVSSNTIRKALQNLARQKVVTFARGRYGGTFVSGLPDASEAPESLEAQSFTWVSINPETIKNYRREKV